MAVSCQAVAEQKNELEHIQIISHNDKLRTEAGSATLIGEAQLAQKSEGASSAGPVCKMVYETHIHL